LPIHAARPKASNALFAAVLHHAYRYSSTASFAPGVLHLGIADRKAPNYVNVR
jgi:hypothetical protein